MVRWSRWWMRALVPAGFVALGWVAMAYGAAITTSSADQASARARSVAVVGDSLIRQTTPKLAERLRVWGFDDHTIAGHPSRSLTSPPITAALDDVARRPGAVLVVATSSNDAVVHGGTADRWGAPAADAEARVAMDRVLRRFDDRCVVVVTAKENVADVYRPAHAVAYNAVLRATAAQHDHVVVVDWATDAAALGTDAFVADGLHVGPEPTSSAGLRSGADGYANAITGGVARCARRVPSR